MPASQADCHIASIPARLHTKGRAAVNSLPRNDWLYMRHEPLPVSNSYGSYIPGHHKLADQSVNSRLLDKPLGSPKDVLFDTKNGNHYSTWQIAAFSLREVTSLSLPNDNTRFRNVAVGPDIYTFKVIHQPTPCMYPHCEIHAFKNNDHIKNNIKSSSMKSVIRREFAKMAQRNRLRLKWQLFLDLFVGFLRTASRAGTTA